MSFTRHAGERSDERNFDRRDVEHVLKTGRFGQPSWDERYRNWKYPVSGTDLDGENLTVIAAIEPAWARLTIITGFRECEADGHLEDAPSAGRRSG